MSVVTETKQTFIYNPALVYLPLRVGHHGPKSGALRGKNMKNIKRNPSRIRKTARRTATNWMDAMTPQGQALYCAEFVDNAYNYKEKL